MMNALEIDSLSKSFAGTDAVKGVSFSIKQGEIFGLLGPNGAGKSTTINMIAGVCRVGGGSITAFGYDNQRDYRFTRRLLGVVHQEIVIDNFFTIDQALKLHAGYYGVKDDPAWRNLLIKRLGLGPHLNKVMLKLSGGLKRRFMIAKALIHKPQLLILDEPTAGVDVELRHGLWDFVREINRQGITILLTTHYLEEAEQMCDRIAIMNHGELIALEKTHELVRRLSSRRLRLWLAQELLHVPDELDTYRPELSEDGSELLLCLPPDESAGDLLKQICALGLDIRDFETDQSGLEEVFLQLTGMREGNDGT
ncbi:ABC-2 type transport system ATP-binding protein [Malonomonas rubra DSM 5091]|uniref:ABC-2 type transport system ATP-binding protein n=1 Tax=Malonomonas rubra DSM 5091 TaxID=1122189 RepID=A0A1M6HI90_MALRU|nr:ABC transporter ATP-binding protein [Malonomonas rubra]SHJ21829.1 ABC-2 type transport system ATP-binding protein [Malonomonas rubra DSM 5091]